MKKLNLIFLLSASFLFFSCSHKGPHHGHHKSGHCKLEDGKKCDSKRGKKTDCAGKDKKHCKLKDHKGCCKGGECCKKAKCCGDKSKHVQGEKHKCCKGKDCCVSDCGDKGHCKLSDHKDCEHKESSKKPASIESARINTHNKIGKLSAPTYKHMSFAGQIQEKDVTELKKNNYKVVINLRHPSEVEWDEKTAVEKAGIKYYNVPLLTKDKKIDPKAMAKLEKIHKETHNEKQLIHCSSGNRAALWMAAHMMLKHGSESDVAIQTASKLGLTKTELHSKLKDYGTTL